MSDPIRTVRALFDALNAHDPDRAAQHIGSAYHGIDATRSAFTVGRADARAEIRAGLTAFPDAVFDIEEALVGATSVFAYWTLDATHEAAFLNLPTTGQSVAVNGTGLFTVKNEQIVHAVHLWDLAGLMRSAGLLPSSLGCGSPESPSER